jgi:hypothetical protein
MEPKHPDNPAPNLNTPQSRRAFPPARLPEDLSAKLEAADWRERDVLVGVLRNHDQLEANVRHRFYHIPVIHVPKNRFPVRHIAIYQSERFFCQETCGVRLCARVLRCSTVRRSDIREIPATKSPNEIYYRFDVTPWQTLERPVLPRDFGPNVAVFTNMFLLENSEHTAQLGLLSPMEFRLYHAVRELAQTAKENPRPAQPTGFEVDRLTVFLRGQGLCVQAPDGRYAWYDVMEFLNRPCAILGAIREWIKKLPVGAGTISPGAK